MRPHLLRAPGRRHPDEPQECRNLRQRLLQERHVQRNHPHHQLQQRHAEDVHPQGQPAYGAHHGNNKATYESFLTLGFGASGKDLQKTWNITDEGTESIDGTSTVKLKLVGKDPAIVKNITYVLIWINTARGISLKQQFVTPAGDSKTTYFTNIRYNQKIDKAETASFAINTNKDTQIDRH